jgi:hypothetical protein
VRYDDQFGILTAAHVVRALEKLHPWFLMVPSGGHMRFDADRVAYYSTPPPQNEAYGPDLGFVRISAASASTLSAYYSFVNLRYHRAKQRKEKPPINHGVWVEAGFPEELGARFETPGGDTVTTAVYCLAATGGARSAKRRGRFDYYHSRVEYEESSKVPRTFKGMSGGGLWQILLGWKKQQYYIRGRIFSGVVFYERTAKGMVSNIRSHGRRSVYGYALPTFILPPKQK